MSDLVKAIWIAKAKEFERIRQAYQEVSYLSIAGNLDRALEMTGTPSSLNEVTAENLILDPHGRSGSWQSIWGASGGALQQFDIDELPRFPYSVRAIAAGGGNLELYAGFTPDAKGLHSWEAIIKSEWLSSSSVVQVRQNFSPFDVVGTPLELAEAGTPVSVLGWTRVGGTVTLPNPATTLTEEIHLPAATINVASVVGFPPAGEVLIGGQLVAYTSIETGKLKGCTGGEGAIPAATAVEGSAPGPHRLELLIGSPTAGKIAYMVCPTVVEGAFLAHPDEVESTPDPEPFSGDLETTNSYAYGWAGARHLSRSRRYGNHFDFLGLREQEAGFSVAPAGMSDLQRQTYILARWQARRKPWQSMFVHLIAVVIRSETNESLALIEESIRVIEDFQHYSFALEIPYSPDGVLTDRIKRLVEAIHPAHLNIDVDTDITWGSFRAGISKAGEAV